MKRFPFLAGICAAAVAPLVGVKAPIADVGLMEISLVDNERYEGLYYYTVSYINAAGEETTGVPSYLDAESKPRSVHVVNAKQAL